MIMNKIKRAIALTMAAVMLMSITGCHKKIEKIDEEDVIAALEDVLGLEEGEDSDDETEHYTVVRNSTGRDYSIVVNVDREEGSYDIEYIIYEDEDFAERHFEYCYECYTDASAYRDYEYNLYYKEGECGYIVEEYREVFLAAYYVDNMMISVSSHSVNDNGKIKEFLSELGLPVLE